MRRKSGEKHFGNLERAFERGGTVQTSLQPPPESLDLSSLSTLTIETAYLSLLDIQLGLETSALPNRVILSPSFTHMSDNLQDWHFADTQSRANALNLLKRLNVILPSASPEDRFAEYSLWHQSRRPTYFLVIDRSQMLKLRRELEAIRDGRELRPPIGPLIHSFPKPKRQLQWKELDLRLISNTEFKFLDPQTRRWKITTHSQAGLCFKNNPNRPKSMWSVFLMLAENGGRLTFHTRSTSAQQVATQKTIERLSKALMAFFGINDSPFNPYSKVNGYTTRFSITDERPNSKSIHERTEDYDDQDTYLPDKLDVNAGFQVKNRL